MFHPTGVAADACSPELGRVAQEDPKFVVILRLVGNLRLLETLSPGPGWGGIAFFENWLLPLFLIPHFIYWSMIR